MKHPHGVVSHVPTLRESLKFMPTPTSWADDDDDDDDRDKQSSWQAG